MKILFYAIVGGLIGYLLGRLHRAIIDRLAERPTIIMGGIGCNVDGHPYPALEKCRICGLEFEPVYIDLGPRITTCDPCWKKKAEGPLAGFEPPIGICPSIHTYRRGHPENRFCCKCGAGEHHPIHDIPAHLKAPQCGFEPPVLSSMPLHEFKKCSNGPYCEECGGGQFHAVHAWATAQNRELWERIQQERAKL